MVGKADSKHKYMCPVMRSLGVKLNTDSVVRTRWWQGVGLTSPLQGRALGQRPESSQANIMEEHFRLRKRKYEDTGWVLNVLGVLQKQQKAHVADVS